VIRRKREAGHVLPLVALCLSVLMGFGGMAVDVGYWEYAQREQQSATDAAALGGAQQLLYSASCPDSTNATAAAKSDAAKNGYTDGSNNVTVAVENPPATGTFSGTSCAVRVHITKKKIATFFTRLFGFGTAGNPNAMTETTEATAEVLADGSGCVFMLGTGDNTNFNGSTVQASKCSIELNGSANFNGATVDAKSIGEANYAGSNNGGTFSGATPAPMLPAADPCPEIAGCAAIAKNPPSTSPCNGSYTAGSGVLAPGCYNNLNLHGATVSLTPSGTFVFAGSANFNGASITGNGVTIYIPAGASAPNFNKVNSLTLTPPTSGSYAGVSYYQDPSNSSGVNFNGSSTNIAGLIYAPAASMNYNGSQGQYAVLVAKYANFNGSSGEDFGSPAGGQSLIRRSVLTL
jgi:Putative Flp pilus-assembly TadE/G-like